jgi:cell wall assembly regulator SMI1
MIRPAEQLWQRIIDKGASREANFEEELHLLPGAQEEDFEFLAHRLGVSLPEEMKALYRLHNGQDTQAGTLSFLRNLTLSPIKEIAENWAFLQEEFDPEDMEPDIEEGLKPLLWNAKWIPIAGNGAGDYLCLDTDPAETGTAGQVLYFWHDWGHRSVQATSLLAFIEMCLVEADESEED